MYIHNVDIIMCLKHKNPIETFTLTHTHCAGFPVAWSNTGLECHLQMCALSSIPQARRPESCPSSRRTGWNGTGATGGDTFWRVRSCLSPKWTEVFFSVRKHGRHSSLLWAGLKVEVALCCERGKVLVARVHLKLECFSQRGAEAITVVSFWIVNQKHAH